MTVAGVGTHLRHNYRVGDRLSVQPAVRFRGDFLGYGLMLQGGMSRYGTVDRRVLCGDEGNYLLPVRAETGYAETALLEPWSCAIAAYRLNYRTGLKAGGTTWIIGTAQARDDYFFSAGLDETGHPACLGLTQVPPPFAARLEARAARLGIEVINISPEALGDPTSELPGFDDIIVLGPDPDIIEVAGRHLNPFGMVAIIAATPLARPVQVDVGRVHYKRWTYVGGTGPDIARAYRDHPIQAELKAGGKSWFLGAGGPFGQMHVQRAVGLEDPPAMILCTARTRHRLQLVEASFAPEAQARNIEFVCLSLDDAAYDRRFAEIAKAGFDNIIVMALAPTAIEDAALYLAPGGVMNIFAGLQRGTLVPLDLSGVYLKNQRFIGHMGTTVEDMRQMLDQVETGRLAPNRLVKAIGSLEAAYDGLQAVREAGFPGKVVIFPQIKPFPLVALPDLKEKLPKVYAKLRDGREWTIEAEEEFLETLLP
jgi:threonine dehydrogenase-like Zn-dependent dehydrogenase